MTFIKLVASLIFLVIAFGKDFPSIGDETMFMGMCILLSSWIFGSAIGGIEDVLRSMKKDVWLFAEEYVKILKEDSEIEEDPEEE